MSVKEFKKSAESVIKQARDDIAHLHEYLVEYTDDASSAFASGMLTPRAARGFLETSHAISAGIGAAEIQFEYNLDYLKVQMRPDVIRMGEDLTASEARATEAAMKRIAGPYIAELEGMISRLKGMHNALMSVVYRFPLESGGHAIDPDILRNPY